MKNLTKFWFETSTNSPTVGGERNLHSDTSHLNLRLAIGPLIIGVFWKYTASYACHWLVNFSLRLATLVEPERAWRIVTSSKHSTIWDGANTIFEFNFQAFGIDATKAF